MVQWGGGRCALWVLLLACMVSLSSFSCSDDDDKGSGNDTENSGNAGAGSSSQVFSALQGTWETIHFAENDEGDVLDKDITDITDEDYCKVRFNQNRTVTILAMGDAEDVVLPLSTDFKLSGNKLYCDFLCGDGADYVTVEFPSADRMTMTLQERGLYQKVTYKKVK